MSEAVHNQLPLWLDPRRREDAPVDLGTLKAELARLGINSRGWRLYLDYGDALFSPLSRPWIHPDQPFTSGPNAVTYLRLLQSCEMDVLPPPALVASLPFWDVPKERVDGVPPLFFRAAWKAAVANQYEASTETEFIREVIAVGRWFFGTGAYETADPGLLKAGWRVLVKRQKAWSLEPADADLPNRLSTNDEWNPYVRSVEWGLYRFEALTTAAQLLKEGEAMQHCVGTYADYCRGGVLRIYSVRERKSGRRVATFSVEYVDYGNGTLSWECDQFSGLMNSQILQQDLIVAADAVLRTYFDLPARIFKQPVLSAKRVDEFEEE